MRLLLLICLGLSLQAKPPLPPLEQKLYDYIKAKQYKHHPIARYIGTWPSHPMYTGARKVIPESNAFMTLQTLLLLDDVRQYYELPEFDTISHLANTQIMQYIKDAHHTNEPSGTIAFWPLLQTDDGKWIRSFDTQWYNRSMRILNVANDFDTSSQAFLWLYRTQQHPEFLHQFVQTLQEYHDLERSVEHPLNRSWKPKDSGAFLTWAEPESPQKSPNRIMDLVNDVDCVVNLNILQALTLYENTIDALPLEVEMTKIKSCQLSEYVLQRSLENQCGTWYTRPSHFYLAFAKAYTADSYCIQKQANTVRKRATKRAKHLLAHPQMKAHTEIAEHLIILKLLKPPSKRGKLYTYLLKDLEDALRKGIVMKKQYAYLPSKHSLFGGEAFGLFHFNWYGHANATALALKALSIP